jgi:hypothetical protein
MDPQGQTVELFPMPVAQPTDAIVKGPGSSLWLSGGMYAEIDVSGTITVTPTLFTTSAVTIGPDGNVWYFAVEVDATYTATNPTVVALAP